MSGRKHISRLQLALGIMIVTCSNCAARYAVDPLAIGPAGRTVECARCHHRWFQRVEVSAGSARPGDPPADSRRHRPASGRHRAQARLRLEPGSGGGGRRGDPVGRGRLRLPPGHHGDDVQRGEVGRPVSVATAASPPAAPAKITMPDPPARAQLEIDVAASRIELIDGHYVVQGEIVNTGQAIGSTSTLKLTFKKDNRRAGRALLRAWSRGRSRPARGSASARRSTIRPTARPTSCPPSNERRSHGRPPRPSPSASLPPRSPPGST